MIAGGGNVVMLSEEDCDNLLENLYVRSNPANYARLIESVGQMESGAMRAHELIEDENE